MFYSDIKDVIKETNIICLSPHYDDFLFFLGGYVFELKKQGQKNKTGLICSFD